MIAKSYNLLIPGVRMVVTGHTGTPNIGLSRRPSLQIFAAQLVAPTLAYAQRFARLFNRYPCEIKYSIFLAMAIIMGLNAIGGSSTVAVL